MQTDRIPGFAICAHCSARRGLKPRAIQVLVEKRLLAAKIHGASVHSLRHTFARMMEDAGAKVSDIQARLGHESLATTGRYLAALRRAENPHADDLAARLGME